MGERIKLNYDDITIVPDEITDICSRSQCNPYDEDGYLPIFASCMSSVVSIENAGDFNAARIRAVIPRSYSVDERLEYLFKNEGNFVAFSLNEARDIFINRSEEFEIEYRIAKRFTNKYHIRDVLLVILGQNSFYILHRQMDLQRIHIPSRQEIHYLQLRQNTVQHTRNSQG